MGAPQATGGNESSRHFPRVHSEEPRDAIAQQAIEIRSVDYGVSPDAEVWAKLRLVMKKPPALGARPLATVQKAST
jgi:hypothetical protein